MDVLEFTASLGGYTLSNKARIVVDGKNIVVGMVVDNKWVYTDKGAELAATPPKVEIAPEPVAEVPVRKTTKARKAEQVTVESETKAPDVELDI